MKLAWLGILALGVMATACEVYDPAAPAAAAPAAAAPAAQPSTQALTATANAPSAATDPAQPAADKPSGCCGSGACQQARAEKGLCPCKAAALAARGEMPSCGGDDH